MSFIVFVKGWGENVELVSALVIVEKKRVSTRASFEPRRATRQPHDRALRPPSLLHPPPPSLPPNSPFSW